MQKANFSQASSRLPKFWRPKPKNGGPKREPKRTPKRAPKKAPEMELFGQLEMVKTLCFPGVFTHFGSPKGTQKGSRKVSQNGSKIGVIFGSILGGRIFRSLDIYIDSCKNGNFGLKPT